MKKILFILLIFSVQTLKGQELIPSTLMLANTWFLTVNGNSGTCFVGTFDGKGYAITAKHLFHKSQQNGSKVNVLISTQRSTTPLLATVYFHKNIDVDAAVLIVPDLPSPTERIPLLEKTNSTIAIGQNLIFLGYPLGIATITNDHTFPIVKRAILSGIVQPNNINTFLLDGHNNSGFSGGPVIATNDGIKNEFVIGMVVGYITEQQKINRKANSKNYVANSGIIQCVPLDLIIDIIKSIPN